MNITQEYMEHLVNKYSDTVIRIAFSYLKNMSDAEDAVQDVFLRIIDKKPSFNDESHERFWITRTTINICKNKLNVFWNKNKCSIDEIAESACYDNYNEDNSVFKAVMSLADKYREVVHMYYYEGYTTPQISKLTGKSEGTVRSLLARAREKLKKILKEDYDFE